MNKNELLIIRKLTQDISLKVSDIHSSINYFVYGTEHYLSQTQIEDKFRGECNELIKFSEMLKEKVKVI